MMIECDLACAFATTPDQSLVARLTTQSSRGVYGHAVGRPPYRHPREVEVLPASPSSRPSVASQTTRTGREIIRYQVKSVPRLSDTAGGWGTGTVE